MSAAAVPSQGVQGVDWLVVAPVGIVVAAALAVLVIEALAPRRRRVLDALSLGSLVLAGAALTAVVATMPPDGARSTFCLPAGGCSYVVSSLTVPLQAVVLAGAALCLLLALGETTRARAEHHLLLLAATAGALTLAAARDLATVVVALETASLPVVGLVALRRTAAGAEAALKLLLTAVVSLGVMLLGVALVYAATGALHLQQVAAALEPGAAAGSTEFSGLARLGTLLVVAGIAFKLSAVPFHLWTPDTYAGAPVPVAAFLAVVSKAAALAALVVVLVVGLPGLAGTWAPLVGVLALASMTVGNLIALRQRSAVRLLAWSTVAQAGWVLLPLAGAAAADTGAGSRQVLRDATSASLGYLLAYAVASLAAFAVVVMVARHATGGPGHGLDAYTGLARRQPWAAVVLGFALACLAGLPPGVMGLVAKVVALRPVVDSGAWVLAIVAAVNVALGLAYYLAWAARLFARPAPDSTAATGTGEANSEEDARWRIDPAAWLAAAVAFGGCLLLSVAPQLVAGLVPGTVR